jgi:NADH-ubiquinone oxidoreductase chain 5
MYLNILLISFFLSVTTLLYGNKIGVKGVNIMILIGLSINSVFACNIFFEMLYNTNCNIELFNCIDLGFFELNIGLYFDIITSIMLLVICLICMLINFYSISYMKFDKGYNRFIGLLILFMFFMILLVISDNYIQLFVGWEGVGVLSYLLINY